MIKDEIVEETRRLRDEYARQFDYDLRRMFEDLKKKQKESGRKYVSFANKKSETDEIDDIEKAA